MRYFRLDLLLKRLLAFLLLCLYFLCLEVLLERVGRRCCESLRYFLQVLLVFEVGVTDELLLG